MWGRIYFKRITQKSFLGRKNLTVCKTLIYSKDHKDVWYFLDIIFHFLIESYFKNLQFVAKTK